ncbi:hypothetical protein BO71DRAFT_435441 [Aspergillus ellipticus CBS 707.79]|uniref:Uncharacterized protein n=1 Tax=Aspergillus ellipticus CBS 707.79 TaxID=1448320 RepID=A0A319DCP8_9EURO|nr:hypothetical protein BO71DRAFT_435441 [Aspergillus ellipticus CBS 707.79]
MLAACDADSDRQFGPRVATNCRGFDFTLLFEDAMLTVVPAALFLLFLPARLHIVRNDPVKVMSYKLAAYKISGMREKTLLTVLFMLVVVYAVLNTRTSVLHTPLSLESDILNIVATAGAVVLSFLEDQRSIRPSDLLVVYFSLLALLWIPRLRSLWLISASGPCRDLWTTIYVITVLIVFLESTRKVKTLRSFYKHFTAEQVLSVGDMLNVDESLQGDLACDKLERAWVLSKGRYRLMKAVFHAYLWPAVSGVVPCLVLGGFTFCQPFLITSTVDYFMGDAKDKPKQYGQALVGVFLLVYLGIAISTAVYWRQAFRLGTMVRAALISSLYQKTTFLATEDVKGSAVLTLMGTDVERIVSSSKVLHEIWASIIEVFVALYLLKRQVYLACLVPAIICLGPISARLAPAQKGWIERVEERVAITSSMLRDMKLVKLLGLTNVFFGLITKLPNVPLYLAPYATFAIYAIISVVRNNQSLMASRAFTSLSLISLMTSPLLIFVQSVPSFTQSIGCFERIEAYLEKAPITNSSSTNPEKTGCEDKVSTTTMISFKNVDIAWSSDSETVFQNLTLEIGKGITMITGTVGSGKSALIKSILGEMAVKKGSILTTFGNIAYCSQTPWIVDDTIRYNITGGTEFDAEWYNFTVSACGLKDDFQSIPGGDMYVAGSSGASLSGGQKQRIALARAIYSRLPPILLDDIFNGLDSKRISDISANLFAENGYFRTAGKTVILVTHTGIAQMYSAPIGVEDNILQIPFFRIPIIPLSWITAQLFIEVHMKASKIAHQLLCQNDAAENDRRDITQKKSELDLTRRDGSWEVYKYYTRSAGPWITAVFVASFIVSSFLHTFSTLWLQWGSDSNAKDPNGKIGWYLGFYTAFVVFGILTFFIGCVLLFINIINDTALTLHTDLLNATLKAPWSFFQTTNVGTMTNRFSQDMDLIDMKLPLWVVNTAANIALVIMSLLLLCAIGKYMAITFPFLIAAFVVIQKIYLRTSRQVRLLDIEAKAPLYTHFAETIDGITSLRVFGWQNNLPTECNKRINQSQRPFYMLFCVQQWLGLVPDLVVAAMAVVLIAIATSLRGQFSAGGMGVALNLVLSLNQILTDAIQAWTQLETSIGAVSRVHNFRNDKFKGFVAAFGGSIER